MFKKKKFVAIIASCWIWTMSNSRRQEFSAYNLLATKLDMNLQSIFRT